MNLSNNCKGKLTCHPDLHTCLAPYPGMRHTAPSEVRLPYHKCHQCDSCCITEKCNMKHAVGKRHHKYSEYFHSTRHSESGGAPCSQMTESTMLRLAAVTSVTSLAKKRSHSHSNLQKLGLERFVLSLLHCSQD